MNIAIIVAGNISGTLAQGFIKDIHTLLTGARFRLSEKSLKLAAIIGANRFAVVENAIIQWEVICF